MLEITEFRYNVDLCPVFIHGLHYCLETDQLLTSADVESVRYTVYEQSTPYAAEKTPLPDFIDISIDPQSVFSEMKTAIVHSKYGDKEINYNVKVIIAPFKRIVDGVESVITPFPVIGKFYRIEIIFEMVDPQCASLPQVEIIQAV